jgi:hypothetical protein
MTPITIKAREGAYVSPLLDYLRAQGPGVVYIDPVRVERDIGIKPRSLRKELHYLEFAQSIQYDDDGSGLISLRVLD